MLNVKMSRCEVRNLALTRVNLGVWFAGSALVSVIRHTSLSRTRNHKGSTGMAVRRHEKMKFCLIRIRLSTTRKRILLLWSSPQNYALEIYTWRCHARKIRLAMTSLQVTAFIGSPFSPWHPCLSFYLNSTRRLDLDVFIQPSAWQQRAVTGRERDSRGNAALAKLRRTKAQQNQHFELKHASLRQTSASLDQHLNRDSRPKAFACPT